ncbi:hypothetical protein B0I35DRAFT_410908 [Stachybotrys elegans]|uniref:Uncharacterized protein n=1 Tax=Stachybotrys elegans TaxID=80388 RepID=A0A8K0SSL1_9HYPO|nr:hypothetical protein B0I35DRAFT_410908 [Stachybotrys elegans]
MDLQSCGLATRRTKEQCWSIFLTIRQRILSLVESVPAPARTAAGVLGALDLLCFINSFLINRALGNSSRIQWDWRREIVLQVGDPTVLVNNAGIGYAKNILDSTNDEIRRTFDVNIVAHFFLVREFLPFMIKMNHGHVVTIASTASFLTIASNTEYSCTKATALAFHEGLRLTFKLVSYISRGFGHHWNP